VIKFKAITSESNSTFKSFLKLTKARAIKKYGLTLLSGPKQVREVLEEFPDRCHSLILSENHVPPAIPIINRIPSYLMKLSLFRQIDLYDTDQPILVIYIAPFPKWDHMSDTGGCTLCIPFQDPVNVGAVIRSAAAFGIPRVIILAEAAHPFHHKSLRASGSSVFRVSIFEGPSIYKLSPPHLPVITLSPDGKDVKKFKFPASFCLIPGLEGPGLPDHLREETCLSIPMVDGVESINSALATGIVLYLWRAQSTAED
jgi:tRNA G18 (ribose-2'-O)-methylase SpoU